MRPCLGMRAVGPGYVLMANKREEPAGQKPSPGVHEDGTSKALSSALKKTFDSRLQEPVPEKFQELIARIREAEASKASGKDDPES